MPAHALQLGAGLVASAGTWERDADGARFRPRFAPVPGTRFTVVEWLDAPHGTWRELVGVEVPAIGLPRTTAVLSIDPAVDVVPVNLLRFRVTFSSPMDEGSAAGHIRLLDHHGETVLGALLEMPPELWDRDRRRLTVLLEPGRIKRGLQPHEQSGAPLREGEEVTAVVEASIRDSAGLPIVEEARRRYRVGPPIRSRVDPARWDVSWAGTSIDPVTVRFDRPLDRVLALRYIGVTSRSGQEVAGVATLDEAAQLWAFRPDDESRSRDGWSLRVDQRLEDLAGNSVRRVFDNDLDQPDESADGLESIQ